MIEVIGIGKNVEKAIEDALLQLKTSRDNVDIKILETGGFFKKAKVEVSISKDYLEEYKKLNIAKSKLLKEEAAKVKEEQPKPQVKKQEQTVSVQAVKVENKKANAEKTVKPAEQEDKKPKEEKAVKIDKVVIEEKPTQTTQPASSLQEAEVGKEFLQKFLSLAKINAVVDVFEDDDEIFYTILGDEATSLIGYRGESLNSLQFLVSVLNGRDNRKSKRVKLDIDGYREKRKNTLELLAKRVAKKVQKTGKQTRLEPMTAYERRIIHTTIQDFEGVSSLSRGQEPHRYLIIKADVKESTEIKENTDVKENEDINETE
jgi:spoIIIJ-associated protein